ncbi:MAG: 30S ribosomal protein S6 [Candidatus Omnitrophota bacterium]|jgi:small subunit ribosomal protein S6|nr:30S ribosomal protein S6 [Candidatus Omnitrophota bacterium]
MRKYEAMLIFKSDLSKEGLEKLVTQVKGAIEKNKGSISQSREWGKQRLAYPIKKYKEGLYYIVNFNIEPDSISKIKRAFSLNESILRALITVL